MPTRARKEVYFKKLRELLDTHNKCFLVFADNVGSKLMSDVRVALRGTATVCMGKNTMMRKVILDYCEENPGSKWSAMSEHIVGNVGFIFVKDDMGAVQEVVENFVVPAPAKAGLLANCDVTVPAGPTGCDPSQTNYFQVMEIPTKIQRGQIEITNDVHLITTGDRVSAGQAALLNKLDIRPFSFGLIIRKVYDNGAVYDAKVLSLTDDVLISKFMSGVNRVAAVSLELGYPTLASIPHSLCNAFRHLLAVCMHEKVDYTFEKGAESITFLKSLAPKKEEAPAAE